MVSSNSTILGHSKKVFCFKLGVYEDEAVPQDYLDLNIPVAERQIVIGGYRLAYIISFIFSSSELVVPSNSGFESRISDISQIFSQ